MKAVEEFTKKIDAKIVETIKNQWVKESAENKRKNKWYFNL